MKSLFTDKRVEEKLAFFGWKPDRHFDTSGYQRICSDNGIEFTGRVRDILENLGDLTIDVEELGEDGHGAYSLVSLGINESIVRMTLKWSKRLEKKLFPIGEVDDCAELFFSGNDEWYFGYGHVWKLGDSIDETFFKLLFPTINTTVKVWPR